MMDFNVVSLKERQDLSDQLDPLSREACRVLGGKWVNPSQLLVYCPHLVWLPTSIWVGEFYDLATTNARVRCRC